MSIKKQEEKVKLLTEVLRMLFTLLLTVSGGVVFMLRAYLNKDPASKGGDGLLLFWGIVIVICLLTGIIWIGFKIKGTIKTL